MAKVTVDTTKKRLRERRERERDRERETERERDRERDTERERQRGPLRNTLPLLSFKRKYLHLLNTE